MRGFTYEEFLKLRKGLTVRGLGVDVMTPEEDPDFQKFKNGESETFVAGLFKLGRYPDNPLIVILSTNKEVEGEIGSFTEMISLH
jgi:hypothetical protein